MYSFRGVACNAQSCNMSMDVESSDCSSACSDGRPVLPLLDKLKAPKKSDVARLPGVIYTSV